MATNLEYIFSMKDYMSAQMQNIASSATKVTGNLLYMSQAQAELNRSCAQTGEAMQKMGNSLLPVRQDEAWISSENVQTIQACRQEVAMLSMTMENLPTSQGGKIKKWAEDALGSLSIVKNLSNPFTAMMQAGQQAMQFDESMAKVRVSTQLDEAEYDILLQKMKAMGKKHKVDMAVVPSGFEAIYSQVKDVDLSMQILDASLKGSKAGFMDVNEVSGTLAKTLSAIGNENTSTAEVMDTLLATKRMGNVGFDDMAKHMPNLINSGNDLGIDYKQIAGAFSYMTGKGNSSEKSAQILESTLGALKQGGVSSQMEKAGVKVFDKDGSMRNLGEIFTDLSALMSSFNDEQKASVLESFGLVDSESKNAFAAMIADTDQLRQSMGEVMQSDGEADRQMLLSANSMQKLTEKSMQLKNIGLELGSAVLPVINVGLDILGGVLDGVSQIVGVVNSGVNWWISQLKDGNPFIIAMTGAIAGVSAALGIYYAWQQSATIVTGIQNVANGAAAATQWLLNTAIMGCPIMWIIGGFALAGAAIAVLWNKCEGFRQVILGVWECVKEFGKTLFDSFVAPVQQVLAGMGALGNALISLVKGDFGEAAQSAKDGAKNLLSGFAGANPGAVITNTIKKGNYADSWDKGWEAGRDKPEQSIKKAVPDTYQPSASSDIPFADLMGSLGGASIKIPDMSFTPGLKDAGTVSSLPGSQNGESVNMLSDIMQNVRKIAAAIVIPVAMALPGESQASELPQPMNAVSAENQGLNGMGTMDESRTIRIDNISIHIQKADANGEEEITNMVKRTLWEALK